MAVMVLRCTAMPQVAAVVAHRGVQRSQRGQLQVVAMGRRAAKIAARKGKSDAIKSKLYGKYGKRIAQCVRTGGDDPSKNVALRDLIEEAKAARVPRDIIDRNLGKGAADAADYKEVVYEAYGPGGTGFLIECLTDNVNRSAADVKSAVTKGGGKWADAGSVAFNFEKKGIVVVGPEAEEEALFEVAVEAGAEDVVPGESEDEGMRVVCGLGDYAAVRAAVAGSGVEVIGDRSGLAYVPNAPVEVDDDALAVCEAMVERLLEVDDVDAVYSNCAGLATN